jgi:hypothetical protein
VILNSFGRRCSDLPFLSELTPGSSRPRGNLQQTRRPRVTPPIIGPLFRGGSRCGGRLMPEPAEFAVGPARCNRTADAGCLPPADFSLRLVGQRLTYRFDWPCGLDMPLRLAGSMPGVRRRNGRCSIDGLSERQVGHPNPREWFQRRRSRSASLSGTRKIVCAHRRPVPVPH